MASAVVGGRSVDEHLGLLAAVGGDGGVSRGGANTVGDEASRVGVAAMHDAHHADRVDGAQEPLRAGIAGRPPGGLGQKVDWFGGVAVGEVDLSHTDDDGGAGVERHRCPPASVATARAQR
jgi:hypothetical protein